MKFKIISLVILFYSCALIAMQQPDQEALKQNQTRLIQLIDTAQSKAQSFISSGQMPPQDGQELVQVTSEIEQETQTLDILIKKIRAAHSSNNQIPKTYFKNTFGNLEAMAKGANSSCNWGICYNNKIAANYCRALSSLKYKLWQADKLFILNPECDITPIKWYNVTIATGGGYYKLIGELDSGRRIAFIKFDEGREEYARFKYCSRTFYEENNLG